ncbi:hypothetical protein EDB92DRAFT_388978 [Lactarius akahatsu]|uniref:Uncharacterized protein n=1 Tax=Lactarius akahatsu TaxID=416441 RepID=A0AAD4L5Y2_9AGAM|nr:hypothetical protein EDB92DRAFT_388978 [Lactarius akahatsu]
MSSAHLIQQGTLVSAMAPSSRWPNCCDYCSASQVRTSEMRIVTLNLPTQFDKQELRDQCPLCQEGTTWVMNFMRLFIEGRGLRCETDMLLELTQVHHSPFLSHPEISRRPHDLCARRRGGVAHSGLDAPPPARG